MCTACRQFSVLVLVGAVLGVASIASAAATVDDVATAPGPRLVTAQRRAVPITNTVVATVASRQELALRSYLSGTIIALPVVLGESVEEGEMLVSVEARELEAALAEALAQRQRAVADLERIHELSEGLVSQRERDRVAAQADAARAAVERVEAKLAYARLTAPFAGVVVERAAEAGEIVMSGQVVLRLADPAQLELRAMVGESAMTAIAVGSVLYATDQDGVVIGQATVREVAPAADPQTRTVLVKADPGSDLAKRLRLGSFQRLRIVVGEEEALCVPAEAVFRRGQLDCVMAVVDDRAQLRVIRRGRVCGDRVVVLAGLRDGDVVIASDPGDVRDGAVVETGRVGAADVEDGER